MPKILSRSTVKVGPKKSEEFLSLNTFVSQRNLSKPWIGELTGFMVDGQFGTALIGIATYLLCHSE